MMCAQSPHTEFISVFLLQDLSDCLQLAKGRESSLDSALTMLPQKVKNFPLGTHYRMLIL